jgi:predicted DNA-binding helix-hairpin-helix protein
MEHFPVDVNIADYKMICACPVSASGRRRRFGRLENLANYVQTKLKKMGIAWNCAKHFIRCVDSIFVLNEPDVMRVKDLILSDSNSKYLKVAQNQLTLF